MTLPSTFTDIIGGDGPGTKEESHAGVEEEGGVVKSPEPKPREPLPNTVTWSERVNDHVLEHGVCMINCASSASGSRLVEVGWSATSTSMEAIVDACPSVQSRDIYVFTLYIILPPTHNQQGAIVCYVSI